ncbi:hypothetical protein [Paracoccus sp. SM22M-07]|uniref:hypothetical protein n=1 Tax=Paracoccus sp. SM22M-07 TaxID=1520813 RepID=UPI000A699F28|nr:hypothetical protein [Paracoccus sp. SM22M-07]
MSHQTPQTRRDLIPVEDYVCPAMPTDEWFRTLWQRFRTRLRPPDKSFIADDRLKRATLRRLDQVVAPPACGPVLAELDVSIRDWLSQPPSAERIKAVVLPPCQDGDVVAAWADGAGHLLLQVDDPGDAKDALARLDRLPDDPETLLVIPRLELWHIRDLDGLVQIRALIAQLTRRRQRVVLSCNAWAWAYLSKSTGIDMIAGKPLCFAPFDAARLRDWFRELAQDDTTQGFRFRLSDDGTDLFAKDPSEAETDFFRKLAAKSRGIPWVAWHMWRRMLHTNEEHGPETRDTLWVAALDELILPGDRPRDTLLILHALLLHGRMTTDTLAQVLPIVGASVVPATLIMSGFVARNEDHLSIRAEAYPAVRAGLENAGMSIGVL